MFRVKLRTRLLAGLLLVATAVIVVFDVATVTAMRDWQIRRIDALLNQVVASHQGRTGDLVAAVESQQPPPMPDLIPNDYYVAIITPDRGPVTVLAPEVAPALPADLAELARSGEIRTIGGAFRLRAMTTPAGILVVAANLRSVTDAIHKLQAILVIATIIAFALLAAGGLVVVRRGLRPLEAIAAQADRITAGDLTRPVAPETPDTEVGRLGQALNRMLGRIHGSIEEQRRFFADASHELRTPLTSLRANAELYEQLTTRAAADEAVRRIRVSAQRMSTLVDEMLRLARLGHEPLPHVEPVDVTAVLTAGLRDTQAVDPTRTWTGDIEAGLRVDGDPDLLRGAVDNLLANVRTHTPAGTAATVRGHRDGEDVVIEIGDDGPGVPECALPRLFDRFYRVNGHSGAGSGLGLAIVAEVVAGHGGSATASTGPGLSVRLTLPASNGGFG